MADKNVQLKNGNDNLYPVTTAANVEGMVGYEEVVSGYSVEVSNISEYNIAIYDGSDESAQMVGYVTAHSTETFTITSGYIFAFAGYHLETYAYDATGGVTEENPATVTSDGTWTINAILPN